MALNFPNVYVQRTEFNKKISDSFKIHKITYINAHIGWGKTTAVTSWIEESGVSSDYFSIENPNTILTVLGQNVLASKDELHAIVIDDFNRISESNIKNQILEYINSTPSWCHFVIVGRGQLSIEFKPYIITGQLQTYNEEDLRFNQNECEMFMRNNMLKLSESDLKYIYNESRGYPVLLSVLVRHIKNAGGKFSQHMIELSVKDLFDYYDIEVFNKWPPEIQDFLIRIAGFNKITPELAQMVTLNCQSKQLLEKCCSIGSFLCFVPPDTYIMQRFCKRYMLYKQAEQLDSEEIKRINRYAGKYYEMIGDHIVDALRYYKAACDYDSVKRLLIEDSSHGVCSSNICNLEPYYRELKDEEILESPQLCGAVAMMHSICCNREESEYWYGKLVEMKKNTPAKTEEYKTIQEQIAYLSIALPHTGAKGVVIKLAKTAKLFMKNGYEMHEMSITGNMPSLMHGGKDFCEWSKNVEPLKTMLRGFVDTVFGIAGAGLVDTGAGEAYYEQNKLDISLIELTKGTTDSRNRGTTEMLFAGISVLVRLLIAKGEYDSAMNMMDGIKERIKAKKLVFLLPQHKAYLIRLQLMGGNTELAKEWFYSEAPDENLHFYTIKRLEYMTKARIYILNEDYAQAEILLERLKIYFRDYERTFDYMEALLLEAVLYYRSGDERWISNMNEVLVKAKEYNFIRIFADEGAAVYPLIVKMKKDGTAQADDAYFSKIATAVHKMAILYPYYLKNITSDKLASLTGTERMVLKLLAKGKKYKEIETVMNVSSNTVKFHVKNIYEKLGVSGRSEAVAEAKEMGII